MKKAFTFLFLLSFSLLIAQNSDSLTINEAYNFSVGDTFRYNVYDLGVAMSRFKPQQIVIKEKKVDSIGKMITYIRQKEEAYLVQTGNRTFKSVFNDFTDILRVEMSNEKVKTPKCPANISPYCWDSIKLDYGGRKTLKHEYNAFFAEFGKEHYSQGLGRTRLWFSGPDGKYNEVSLLYYNKNGQNWGNYSNEIATARKNITPLKVREVYDFEVGDVFIYEKKGFFSPMNSTLTTRYERRTIQSRSNTGNSIMYTYKNESANKDTLYKVTTIIDTLRVTDLDSLAISKVKPQNIFTLKTYNSDSYSKFYDSNRDMNSRYLVCDCFDFSYSLSVAKGLGIVLEEPYFPLVDKLIYFKKGSETWGTPVDFSTSINTPSVSASKIILSPNPTRDFINIETDVLFNKIQIVNINGQPVYSTNNESVANVSQLPNGVYFLQIFVDNELKGAQKFIKFK